MMEGGEERPARAMPEIAAEPYVAQTRPVVGVPHGTLVRAD